MENANKGDEMNDLPDMLRHISKDLKGCIGKNLSPRWNSDVEGSKESGIIFTYLIAEELLLSAANKIQELEILLACSIVEARAARAELLLKEIREQLDGKI